MELQRNKGIAQRLATATELLGVPQLSGVSAQEWYKFEEDYDAYVRRLPEGHEIPMRDLIEDSVLYLPGQLRAERP